MPPQRSGISRALARLKFVAKWRLDFCSTFHQGKVEINKDIFLKTNNLYVLGFFKNFFHSFTSYFYFVLISIFMIFIGIIFIAFSLLIFVMPELVAYIIASFILIIGVNILTMGIVIAKNRPKNEEKSFSFMGYEIVKRRK